jgi:hypothetical protein
MCQDVSECTSCPAGYFCISGTGSLTANERCPEGYFCPSGTKSPNENRCTVGHFCPAGAAKEQECDVGFYSDDAGLSGKYFFYSSPKTLLIKIS